jgi:hypothetical protein
VDPKHDWQTLLGRVLRGVDIKNVAFVPVLHVWNVRRQSLRSSTGAKENKRENEGGNEPEIHQIDSLRLKDRKQHAQEILNVQSG